MKAGKLEGIQAFKLSSFQAFVIAVLLCIAAGGCNKARVEPIKRKSKAELVAFGKEVYLRARCDGCHTIKGVGAKLMKGPELSGISKKRSEKWLKDQIRHPERFKPDTAMRPFEGTDEELEALIEYLNSL